MDKKPTHTVMSKKLAEALMESGMQHFSAETQEPQKMFLGGIVDALGAGNNYSSPGFTGTQRDYIPRIDYYQGEADKSLQQQRDFANALLAQAQGVESFNPAIAQLNNTTGQNIQQQGALMASQRGASANPALLARQAAMQGGQRQQDAVGQAALLRAQQQAQAQAQYQQQLAQIANQIQAGEALQQQGFLNQQANLAGVANNANNINAGVAAGNQAMVGSVVGSLLNAGGAALGKPPSGGGAAAGGGASGASVPAGMMVAAHGGEVPPVTGHGVVPGQAEKAGDHEANDKVPAMLSPGEVVLPRSIAQHPDAPAKAAEFMRYLQKNKRGYAKVADAKRGSK